MDDRRFDQLVRLLGQGASRRTVFKGLLGLGSAGIAAEIMGEQVDARTARTRPTIPPPPPLTTTPPPTTTTSAPCPPGEEQCPDSTLCCPAGACARSGNQAICCAGYVCGLECCGSEYECCDGECCASGHTCLTSVFAEGPNVEEEMCCPAHLACDNQCCNGSCYSEYGGPVWYEDYGLVFNGHPVAIAGTHCCAAGGTVCDAGVDGYVCCGGNTPKCCPSDGETPGVCRAEGACCTDADCDTCERCTNGTCDPIPGGAICEGPESAICCFGETPGCCIRDGDPICLFGRACCDDSQCDAGECDVCDVSLGAASNCVSRDSVCEDLYGPGCTCSLGQCSCPTTTRDPNLCLELDMTCDPATNRCCTGLGCLNPYGVEPYCDYCISDNETRCRHDSNCCPGLLCLFGTCRSPECRSDSDCDTCQVCNEQQACVDAPAGSDPGGRCGPCSVCQLIPNLPYDAYIWCAPVTEGETDPLDRCPVEGAICCNGTCSGSAIDSCTCTSDEDCGPCLVCDEGSGNCLADCRTGAAGECCQGDCHYCHGDTGLCHDDDSFCDGECKTCRYGACVDDPFMCGFSSCYICSEGQCLFDCHAGGGEECCSAGPCGRAYCAEDGSCVIEPDPREVCQPCHECRLDVFGEYSCQAVADGSDDPLGACGDGESCCAGVCSANESCGGCMVDADCGPCLSCVSGSCFPDCNRRPDDGSSCCFGCLECDRSTGRCEEESDNCPGCADCEGGICVSDDGDCGDCEICVNSVCVFNCNNELGVGDCCENTGSCGTPLCGTDGQCAYEPNPAACTNACEECVDTGSGGPYNCRSIAGCECSVDHDCGLCGFCDDDNACAVLPNGTRVGDFGESICCGGAFFEFGECCSDTECAEDIYEPICNVDLHACVRCLVDTDCDPPESECDVVVCEDREICVTSSHDLGVPVVIGGTAGICCVSRNFGLVFHPGGTCCEHIDCPGTDSCCGGTCQSDPCGCEDDSFCQACETCGALQLCSVVDDGTLPSTGFGICCGGEFFDGNCCTSADCCPDEGCPTAEYSHCLGHNCVQCISDTDCQFNPDNPCVIQGCDSDYYCFSISAPNGPVTGGQCCDGNLIALNSCCTHADCASTPDTPICHPDTHKCAECYWLDGCPQCESCDETGHCRFDCNYHYGNPAACCPGIGNQCDSEPVGQCICQPGRTPCSADPEDPEAPAVCAECCGSDASNCLNINATWDAECVACSGAGTNVCVAANDDGVCTVDATARPGFCNNHVCEPCQDGGVFCNGNDFVCCSGVCDATNLCTAVTGLVGSEAPEECIAQPCDVLGCGPHEDDGCGNPVDCGECPTTTPAPCAPRTECNPGECGEVDAGCGQTIHCNDCPTTPAPCIPGTCESLGGVCGQSIDDGCGTTIYCGDCPTTTPPCTARGGDCSDSSECCEGDTCRAGKCRRARA